MRINVQNDTTRRTIRFSVIEGEAPDLDITQRHHKKPRAIRPYGGTLVLVDDLQESITVSGPLVLKSGKTSDMIGEDKTWKRPGHAGGAPIDQAPLWVLDIWNHAADGVTAWSWPDE